MQVVGLRLVVAGVTILFPPAGLVLQSAVNVYAMYNMYQMGSTLYTMGSHIATSGYEDGLAGVGQAIEDIGSAFGELSAEDWGGMVGGIAAGKGIKMAQTRISPFSKPPTLQGRVAPTTAGALATKTFQNTLTPKAAKLTTKASPLFLCYSPKIAQGNRDYGMIHILMRHSFDSTCSGVSRFPKGWGATEIRNAIEEALAMGQGNWEQGRNHVLNVNMGRMIGFDTNGNETSLLKIVVHSSGRVTTAYPFTPRT